MRYGPLDGKCHVHNPPTTRPQHASFFKRSARSKLFKSFQSGQDQKFFTTLFFVAESKNFR